MLATIVLGAVWAAMLALILERRIGAINDSIAGILSGDLRQRIPVARGGDDDDFKRLIVNFNHMLDRIAQLMEDLKQLSDNIAHDLRTPLTRLRNRLASIEFDGQGGRSEAVAQLLQESDELLATFNALLRIAQIESGNRRSGFAATDLVTILRDVCEFYEPLAADKEQTVSVALPPSCPACSIATCCSRPSRTCSTTRSSTRRRVATSRCGSMPARMSRRSALPTTAPAFPPPSATRCSSVSTASRRAAAAIRATAWG